ncbi:MAG: pilus assembly protein TadG-related protein [Acidimicrobiales bacterium]
MTLAGQKDERGSVTLWVLGLAVMMLFIGGISLDLWRAFAERRSLAGMVDAAAVAGASGIDTAYFRQTSQLRLEPALAEQLANESLRSQPDTRSLIAAQVSATPSDVSVGAVGEVEFTLLRVFMSDEPFTVRVGATARPRRSA